MKILITGITGFLGPYLRDEFSKDPENEVTGVSSTCSGPDIFQCNLIQPEYVQRMMDEIKPDLVIHAAAMTDVARCQSSPSEAWKANVVATKNIALRMPDKSRLIYISSDAVYSGQGPHSVNGNTVNPLNVYGMTKYMGELEAARHPNHLIVRTTMVGASRSAKKSSSLVDFLLDKLIAREKFNIFTDCFFSPLPVESLAILIRRHAMSNRDGMINLGSLDGMPKAYFAMQIAHHLGLSMENAIPVASADLPTRVQRSLDTRLYVRADDIAGVDIGYRRMCEEIKKWRKI